MNCLRAVGLATAALFLLPMGSWAESPKPNEVRFCAMGDYPYKIEEWDLLKKHIRELPDDIDFIVHLGDIKRGKLPCFEPTYKNVAAILKTSQVPAFIVLGDNEWNDCLRPATGLKYWHRHLLRLDDKWQKNFIVQRDAVRPENFAFRLKNVLFIGINIVGGEIRDRKEWDQRHAENLQWIQLSLQRHPTIGSMVILGHARPNNNHDDFFDPLKKVVRKFDRPVLYLHGDGHKWERKKSFRGLKNFVRIQVTQGGEAKPVKIYAPSFKAK